MGTMLRVLVIVTVALVAYEMFTRYCRPDAPPLTGRFAQVRLVARKARLVALIYVGVIVLSGLARLVGWIE